MLLLPILFWVAASSQIQLRLLFLPNLLLVSSDTNGCRGYALQDVVVFNTGLSSANDGKPQIRLFPNPSSSEMNISVLSNHTSTLTIELFDIKGTQIAVL